MPPPSRDLTTPHPGSHPAPPRPPQGPCRQLSRDGSGHGEDYISSHGCKSGACVSAHGAPGHVCLSHSLWPDVQTWTTGPGGGGGDPRTLGAPGKGCATWQ